ncbi:hypothetical protein GUJ93_ZPchr0034g18731 [Zizania palustris]|uniref:Uncharacterized protein n=1 Tax=Zizania palustris TaxID=103762 RepID=A0A8J5R5W3_ZIZPA|nr:hypothetical protein GUJ93_ZPchr0034g18731 [Zizania palustris]
MWWWCQWCGRGTTAERLAANRRLRHHLELGLTSARRGEARQGRPRRRSASRSSRRPAVETRLGQVAAGFCDGSGKTQWNESDGQETISI